MGYRMMEVEERRLMMLAEHKKVRQGFLCKWLHWHDWMAGVESYHGEMRAVRYCAREGVESAQVLVSGRWVAMD